MRHLFGIFICLVLSTSAQACGHKAHRLHLFHHRTAAVKSHGCNCCAKCVHRKGCACNCKSCSCNK